MIYDIATFTHRIVTPAAVHCPSKERMSAFFKQLEQIDFPKPTMTDSQTSQNTVFVLSADKTTTAVDKKTAELDGYILIEWNTDDILITKSIPQNILNELSRRTAHIDRARKAEKKINDYALKIGLIPVEDSIRNDILTGSITAYSDSIKAFSRAYEAMTKQINGIDPEKPDDAQKETEVKTEMLFKGLPCEIGATLYDITEFAEYCPQPEMYEIIADYISIEKNDDGEIRFSIDGCYYSYNDFGKILFTDKEEAERKIDELCPTPEKFEK